MAMLDWNTYRQQLRGPWLVPILEGPKAWARTEV
jgi:hypothetical protein